MANLIGQASPDQIQAWKKEHGRIFKIEVDGHVGYFKTPDRKILGFAAVTGDKDPIKYNEAVMNNCFIGGSEAIKTDDSLFLGASAKLGELIQIKEATLEEL